jgi:glycosyltransferase involved in cell wall biosynthesis
MRIVMKNNYPVITIITPTLNQKLYIEETILSVLSQNYPNLEYIIADGGSTDGTKEILKKYSGDIIWFSRKDKGQSQAINRGIEKSTGNIIAYLNSDDLLLPNALFKIADAFGSHPEIQWITGYCMIINEQSREIRQLITFYKKLLLHFSSLNLLLITDYISQPATFWRREMINEVGLFNEDFHFAMDYDYLLTLMEKSRPLILKDYLAGFRVHRSSKSTNLENYKTYIQEEEKLIKQHTSSRFLSFLHDTHRVIMTTIYMIFNR